MFYNKISSFKSYYKYDQNISLAFAELIRSSQIFFNEKRAVRSLFSMYVNVEYDSNDTYESMGGHNGLFSRQVDYFIELFKKQNNDRLRTYSYILFDKKFFMLERVLGDIVRESEENSACYHAAFCCLNMITSIFRALSNVLRLSIHEIYSRYIRDKISSSTANKTRNALFDLFKQKTINSDSSNIEKNATEDFEAWCMLQRDLCSITIQSTDIEVSISYAIRDFAFSELISGSRIMPNKKIDRQRLVNHHKIIYIQKKKDAKNSGVSLADLNIDDFESFINSSSHMKSFNKENVYESFCQKLSYLKSKLRYNNQKIMETDGNGSYTFTKSFIQQFYFITAHANGITQSREILEGHKYRGKFLHNKSTSYDGVMDSPISHSSVMEQGLDGKFRRVTTYCDEDTSYPNHKGRYDHGSYGRHKFIENKTYLKAEVARSKAVSEDSYSSYEKQMMEIVELSHGNMSQADIVRYNILNKKSSVLRGANVRNNKIPAPKGLLPKGVRFNDDIKYSCDLLTRDDSYIPKKLQF
jgi:hypothetical protein